MIVKIDRASDWGFVEYRTIEGDDELMKLIREVGDRVIVKFGGDVDSDVNLTDYDDYVE